MPAAYVKWRAVPLSKRVAGSFASLRHVQTLERLGVPSPRKETCICTRDGDSARICSATLGCRPKERGSDGSQLHADTAPRLQEKERIFL